MKRFLALIAAFFVLCSSVSAVDLDSSSPDEQTNEDVSKIEAIIEEIPKESPVADVSGQEVPSGSSDSEVSSGGSPIYVLESPASSESVDYGDLTDIPVGASIDNITVTSVSPIEPTLIPIEYCRNPALNLFSSNINNTHNNHHHLRSCNVSKQSLHK